MSQNSQIPNENDFEEINGVEVYGLKVPENVFVEYINKINHVADIIKKNLGIEMAIEYLEKEFLNTLPQFFSEKYMNGPFEFNYYSYCIKCNPKYMTINKGISIGGELFKDIIPNKLTNEETSVEYPTECGIRDIFIDLEHSKVYYQYFCAYFTPYEYIPEGYITYTGKELACVIQKPEYIDSPSRCS